MVARALRWVLLLALAGSLLAACGGGRSHLVGLRDVSLGYVIAGGPPPPADDLRGRVLQRLAAADLAAEVEASAPGALTLRVDESLSADVRRLLDWRGGLAVAVATTSPAAGEGAPVEGERDAIARLAAERPDPPGQRLAFEHAGAGRARLRRLEWPPVTEIDTDRASAEGPGVVLPLTPGSEAELDALLARRPAATLAIVRGRTVVAVLDGLRLREDHRLIVPLGSSIAAYTEAANLARLLQTPRLPPLALRSETLVAPDWPLAGANLLLPLAVSLAWLFFVRRFDRAQPEPIWLVFLTFGLGAVAVVPAGLIEWAWDSLSPYTNPTLLTFGHAARAFPVALVGFIVTVGVTEEGAKLLATWSLATHRREFDEPVDGMVYGAAAALGFAAAENVRYLALGRVDGALVASRAFMSVPAHLFFGTIWGYALGRRLVEPGRRVWPLFLAAAALHGLFDACLSVDGGLPWACLVAFAVASIFVLHLRLALRHGPVTRTAGATPVARGDRELFRMGSSAVFGAFVLALYGFAAVLFLLVALGDTSRAGVPLVAASAVAFGLLGWSARGVAATLPLDVVVDDAGVTFAGASLLYRDVVRIERRRVLGSPRRQEQMLIIGEGRRLVVGPASHETIDALAHALAMRLSSTGLRS